MLWLWRKDWHMEWEKKTVIVILVYKKIKQRILTKGRMYWVRKEDSYSDIKNQAMNIDFLNINSSRTAQEKWPSQFICLRCVLSKTLRSPSSPGECSVCCCVGGGGSAGGGATSRGGGCGARSHHTQTHAGSWNTEVTDLGRLCMYLKRGLFGVKDRLSNRKLLDIFIDLMVMANFMKINGDGKESRREDKKRQ